MAYIKERGENTYLVRITIGTDGHGKPVQKSRTFHPSKSNLPKTKLKRNWMLSSKHLKVNFKTP